MKFWIPKSHNQQNQSQKAAHAKNNFLNLSATEKFQSLEKTKKKKKREKSAEKTEKIAKKMHIILNSLELIIQIVLV
jgi:hypothetical protein